MMKQQNLLHGCPDEKDIDQNYKFGLYFCSVSSYNLLCYFYFNKGDFMKVCISCKENKPDNAFSSYEMHHSGDSIRRKVRLCKKCRNSSKEGVAADIVGNGLSLKSKAFVDRFTTKNFSDCAIDEMGLSYDEFDDIPGLDD